jgi:hypothetical protein
MMENDFLKELDHKVVMTAYVGNIVANKPNTADTGNQARSTATCYIHRGVYSKDGNND